MRILVLNNGSSSVKYRLYDGDDLVSKGLVERVTDYAAALREVTGSVDLTGLGAVGHRVVHGGLRFSEPTLITDEVVAAIEELVPLAPLHNPANLAGIGVARKLLPGVPQVAVFDTAFHRTLPEAAATYAIDREVADRYGIHRYGFHGTSHAYVSRRTATLLDRPLAGVNTITLHLGNGASACAVEGGRSVATSMGLTPLEGLVMGSRSGDLDPAVVFHLHRTAGMPVDEIDDLLNHRGGLMGLAGAGDMREVLSRRAAGDRAAALAIDVYCRRIRSYVGAYYAVLGRLDAIAFTAGVGENAAAVRAESLAGLDRLGIEIDAARNDSVREGIISPEGAPVTVCVVPTDEELEIATQTRSVINGSAEG
ncbi:acetate/propionate family kinase [Phytohabitans aurantiacus]|jgi:acetate kinase|uniref:Acetate kinase n=1 Tax=Phytohabitans aurantiacus TaxID=3016789 RepID=A0ABQ5QU82_9ACTN|nr:acetate kinase [Phytohabitans aurantiacus]GLH97206.1 acetate kinase [Phytohabitans aurantiacus]